jgi:hypothetical protein
MKVSVEKFSLYIIICTGCLAAAAQAQTRRTNAVADNVKSLKVHLAGNFMAPPVLETNTGQQAEISFDILGHEYNSLSYSVEHCDADWNPSPLSPLEFLDGIPTLINDYAPSRATTTLYTHYVLRFPNSEVRPRISGNYAIHIFHSSNPANVILTACLSVTEAWAGISAEITGNTLADFNLRHQQVNLEVTTNRFPINNPAAELQIRVMQNNRYDNMAVNPSPTVIASGRVAYHPSRSLIFEAGNEFRRFEFLSPSYNGMGVDNTRFHNPHYHVTLLPLSPRPLSYQYDQDQNGRYLNRCSRCADPSTEADYCFVHFSLQSPQITGGNLYIMGDLTYNIPDPRSQMEYNPETRSYEKHLFLKQGHYNYSLLFIPDGRSTALSDPIERNFYQTQNEYAVYVYYRPFGSRYDRLAGFSTASSGVAPRP